MLSTSQRRARLWHRHHLARVTDVSSAVRALVALHSSDPLTPHLALRARVAGFRPERLQEKLDDGTLWRLHAMRRTLWVVASDEAPVFDGAAARAIAAQERRRVVGWVGAQRDAAEAWLGRLEAAALEAIAASPGVATRALTDAVPGLATKVRLGSGKWVTEAAIGSRLLFVLAMEGKLRRAAPAGSWRSSQYGWVVSRGFGDRLPEEEARPALLRRYLDRFGPVTFTDAKWWTGWTVSQTRAALAASGAVEVPLDDGAGFVLPDDVEDAPAPRGVALLPGLDPTPMGYKQRSWYLGDHEAALFDRNGNVGPTIWADGRIVGGWSVRPDGVVVTRLLEPADASAVQAEAARLTAWLDGTAVTPRFRTPLERQLAAASA